MLLSAQEATHPLLQESAGVSQPEVSECFVMLSLVQHSLWILLQTSCRVGGPSKKKPGFIFLYGRHWNKRVQDDLQAGRRMGGREF